MSSTEETVVLTEVQILRLSSSLNLMRALEAELALARKQHEILSQTLHAELSEGGRYELDAAVDLEKGTVCRRLSQFGLAQQAAQRPEVVVDPEA